MEERKQYLIALKMMRVDIDALRKGLHKGIVMQEDIERMIKQYEDLITITENQIRRFDNDKKRQDD